jgi:hypothetical protein
MTSEPVGTVAEEAAKLFAAVSDWAISSGSNGTGTNGAAGAGSSGHEHADLAEGSPECRLCPWCQLLRHARAATPEVREHFTSAATSLAFAIKGLLDNLEYTGSRHNRSGRDPGVEKIDLMEDVWD